MSYVNYWGNGKHVSPNGDFGVKDIPEVNHLVNSLERNRWIFTNSAGDGIYEMSKAADSFKEDGFHPSDEIQKQWAQIIADRLDTDASVNM